MGTNTVSGGKNFVMPVEELSKKGKAVRELVLDNAKAINKNDNKRITWKEVITWARANPKKWDDLKDMGVNLSGVGQHGFSWQKVSQSTGTAAQTVVQGANKDFRTFVLQNKAIDAKQREMASPPIKPEAAPVVTAGTRALPRGGTPLDVSAIQNKYTTVDNNGLVTTTYLKGSGGAVNHSAFGKKIGPDKLFPANEAELHYQFKPDKNFDWARGGKLPGLWVGEGKASGYEHSSTAASARVMWKANGGAIGYVYTMNGTKNPAIPNPDHGGVLFANQGFQLKAGQWNDVSVRVKLNSIGKNGKANRDGELTVTINGKALTMRGIQWRLKEETKISETVITTFFGGPDKSPKTQGAQFRGFEVKKYS